MAYLLSGSGAVGPEARPLREGQLALFGPGDIPATVLHR
jgi:quercetin 2,3-dioxygenase